MPQTKQAMSETIKQEILSELQNKNGMAYEGQYDHDRQNYQSAYSNNRALAESIKKEILAEMEAEREAGEQVRYRQQNNRGRNMSMGSSGGYRPRLGRADTEGIKREILMELQGEFEEHHRHSPEYYSFAPVAGYGMHPYDRAVADSVKKELLAEMEARHAVRQAEMYGYGHLVSDRNLNKMIEQRYRTIHNIREDLRKEIEAIKKMESKMTSASDPYVGELAHSIVKEARQQGVPLDEVLKRLEEQPGANGAKNNWRQRAMEMINTGQRKGFLYGVGAALLAAMILPTAKQNMHSVAVRTIEEGMELADRARSMVARAREGVEDIIAEANFKNLQEEVPGESENYVEPDITILED